MDRNFKINDNDRKGAIEALGCGEELYEKYLRRFISLNSDKAGEIRALVHSGNIKDAHREAHSLKGISATLGLNMISAVSASLEHMLYEILESGVSHIENISEIYSLTDILEDELKKTCV